MRGLIESLEGVEFGWGGGLDRRPVVCNVLAAVLVPHSLGRAKSRESLSPCAMSLWRPSRDVARGGARGSPRLSRSPQPRARWGGPNPKRRSRKPRATCSNRTRASRRLCPRRLSERLRNHSLLPLFPPARSSRGFALDVARDDDDDDDTLTNKATSFYKPPQSWSLLLTVVSNRVRLLTATQTGCDAQPLATGRADASTRKASRVCVRATKSCTQLIAQDVDPGLESEVCLCYLVLQGCSGVVAPQCLLKGAG